MGSTSKLFTETIAETLTQAFKQALKEDREERGLNKEQPPTG